MHMNRLFLFYKFSWGGFSLVIFLLLMVFVVVGVTFLTMLERKVLGYVDIRKSPNRLGFNSIDDQLDATIMVY